MYIMSVSKWHQYLYGMELLDLQNKQQFVTFVFFFNYEMGHLRDRNILYN